MRKLFVVLVIGALLIAAALVSRTVSAASPQVGATDATVEIGEHGTSQLFTHDFAAPGLGAWTIDVHYDPDVITVTSCTPVSQTSVCNPDYAEGVVRSAGANAQGLDGSPILAEITFECAEREGTSALEVRPRDVSDATIGGPQLLAVDLSDGVVHCVVENGTPGPTPTLAPMIPEAGSGPGAVSGMPIALALLAVLGSGLLMFVAGSRVYPRKLG